MILLGQRIHTVTLQGSAWLSNMYVLGGVDQTPSDISMSAQSLTSEETCTSNYYRLL